MSSDAQSTRGANRGRRTNRRGGNRGGGPGAAAIAEGNSASGGASPANAIVAQLAATAAAAAAEAEGDDAVVCWICAEPVKYWCVSECNHRTCHVCALRLRALYKKQECTFCKEPQSSVIFTISPDTPFGSYTPNMIPFKDSKLGIHFETEEMMEDTVFLLRFNCPDTTCDYIAATGWGDLKLHVRGVHGKQMCDLCVRNKKVFSHEHALYPPDVLPLHLPSLGRRNQYRKPVPPEQIEGGIHPLCEFCRDCFFSSDEIYSHMRERHEECFVCKRADIRDQYFQNYDSLETHFNTAHHPCQHRECLARKFVVFGSAMDLQAHMVEEHGAAMSSQDRRNAMRIQADFTFEDVGVGGARGGRGGRGGGGGGRPNEREPPPIASAPSRGGGTAGGNRRREGFGTHLTSGDTPTSSPRAPSPVDGSRGDVDPTVAERHDAFMARLQSLAPNPQNATIIVKSSVRSYRARESAARDLISSFWNVLGEDLDNTATLISMLVDLLDDEEQKSNLLAAWNGFKVEQRRQFPDLQPTTMGSGFANITSGRVLNAKQRAAQSSSRQVWDRVAQAASSSSSSYTPPLNARFVPGAAPPPPQPARLPERFPPLNPAGPTPGVPRAAAGGQHKTAWSASASGGGAAPPAPSPAPRAPFSVPGPAAGKAKKGTGAPPPPVLSNSAFPTLPPSSGGPRVKPPASGNKSLRAIVGEPAPVANPWASGGSGGSGSNVLAGEREDEDETVVLQNGGGGKKKGKGKQKQTLFTLGTMPS